MDFSQEKKRVRWLDELRLRRAIQDSPQSIEIILHLLPILFHFNHPQFTGFVADCPQGIEQFSLSPQQTHFLNRHFPKLIHRLATQEPTAKASFAGIYTMGSVGSVSQTPSSDLDIWLCVNEGLSATEFAALQKKVSLLQEWALSLGVVVSLYIIEQNRFRGVHYASPLSKDKDSSGTAQHMLLLDEFYRTCIRLAGKPILWLHLCVDDEKDYDTKVKTLVEAGELDLNDWTDFGGLGDLSANEYFGATLWQLYKGIDSPYKSALKILLLESYSCHYPSTKLISQQFKAQLHQGDTDYHFDAYLCMLEWVSVFLSNNDDQERLTFAYRCFYLKVRDSYPPEKTPENNWRLQVLQQLTEKWGWSEGFIQSLNHRPQWRIKALKQQHNDLLTYLMASYRNLLQFVRKHKVNAHIVPQDMAILSRKLYTAFEELPGKVIFVNASQGRDLQEKALTFVDVENNHSFKKGWYVLNHAPEMACFTAHRHCEFGETLPKIVAWTYFNGLLTPRTKVFLKSERVALPALRQFAQDLCRTFPQQMQTSEREFIRHCKIRQLFIAINLSNDVTVNLDPKDSELRKAYFSGDLFHLTEKENRFIGSIDAIYRNRWGEIRTLHFEGEDALIRLLKVLTQKIPRASTSLQSVHIFSYAVNYQKELLRAVQDLIYRTLGIEAKPVNEDHSATIISHKTLGFGALFKPEAGEGGIATNDYPQEIAPFASEGFLQFFFEDNDDKSYNVFVLNEQNRIEVYRACVGDKIARINEINQLYQTASVDSQANPYGIVRYHFNYPQFYELILNQNNQRQIVPFRHHLKMT